MLICQSTLDVGGVWRSDRSVRCQFDARALDECSGRHNDIVRIAWHIGWLRCVVGIDRRVCLDGLAEGDHLVCIGKRYGLNEIRSFFCVMRRCR